MVRPIRLLPALVIVLAITGCAATTATAPTATMAPEATPTVLAATATAMPKEAAGLGTATPAREGEVAVVLVYRRSGGFAGLNESWTVYDDGTIVDGATGKESTTSSESVAGVLAQADAAGLFDARLAVDRMSGCRDCFTYYLLVSDGTRQNVITFEDAQKDVPDAVWQLLSAVQALVEG